MKTLSLLTLTSSAFLATTTPILATEGFIIGLQGAHLSSDIDGTDYNENTLSFYTQNKLGYGLFNFQFDAEYGEYLDEGFLQLAGHISYDVTDTAFIGAFTHYAGSIESQFDEGITLIGLEGGNSYGPLYIDGSIATDVSDRKFFDTVVNLDGSYDLSAYIDGLGSFVELTYADFDNVDLTQTSYLIGLNYELGNGFHIQSGIGQYILDQDSDSEDLFNARIALVWGGERNLVNRQRAISDALSTVNFIFE